MAHCLSSCSFEQLSTENFVREGFVVLEGFLPPDRIPAVQTAIDTHLSRPHGMACTRPHNILVPLRWNDRIVELLLAPDSRQQMLAEVISAEDLKWISGYVSLKEAYSPPLWWHQDWWCWDHPMSYRRAAPQVALLCYLEDTDECNGALRILPGSHHRSFPIHAVLPEAHGRAAEEIAADHIALSDLPGQRTLRLNAGDAAVIDYRLLHGTHGNVSSKRRDCVLLSFTPSWAGLPEDIKAHLIDHPAQPAGTEEASTSPIASLLPAFDGPRRSLPLNRNAPAMFEVA